MTAYLDLDDVMAVAAAALAPAEVLVRDVGQIESALARPQASAFGEDAYPDRHGKAASLLDRWPATTRSSAATNAWPGWPCDCSWP